MGQHRRPAGADARALLKREIACAREAFSQRAPKSEGTFATCARPRAAYAVPGENELVADIAQALEHGPCEVSSMCSRYAKRFNETVRKSAVTPFIPDGKNDGSFKDWLIQCGFVVDPPFARNKRLLHLPATCAESMLACQETSVEASPPKNISKRRDERIWKKKEEPRAHRDVGATRDANSARALDMADGSVEKQVLQRKQEHTRDSDPAYSVQQECVKLTMEGFGDDHAIAGHVEAVDATAEDHDIASTWTLADVPDDSEETWVIVPQLGP